MHIQISLTDIARYKNTDDPRFVIQNWLRNRNTLEFIGLWEALNNPNFNRVQFDTFRSEADMLNITEPVNQYREEKNHGAWGRLVVLYGRPNSKGSYAHVSVLRVGAAHHARASYAQVTMPAARAVLTAGAVPTLHATAAPGLTPGIALKQRVARRLSVGIRIVTVVVLVFSANAIVARSCMRTLLRS